jgi:NAD+ kinase
MPRSSNAVGLYFNRDKSSVRKFLPELVRFLRSRGATPLGLEDQAADLPAGIASLSMKSLARRARFLLVLGGDGTFLSAARRASRQKLPLLGLRLGRTGFLTPIEARDFRKPLGQVLKGRFLLEQHAMVGVKVLGQGGRVVARGIGLNDVTVRQLDSLKVVRLSLVLDRERLGEFTADGLVVATPTGATGYSLSAGGPVVVPGARVLLATLLCPHTISSRPVVFSPDQTLEVRVEGGESGLRVLVDGQEELPLGPRQYLSISTSPYFTRVIRPPGFSYPELLRNKLGWKA